MPAPFPVSSAPRASLPADTAELWKKLLSELWKKPTVASHMERAHLKSAGPSEWVIGFVDAFAMASVQRNLVFLEEMVAAVVGRPIKVRLLQQARDRREGEDATVVIASMTEEKERTISQDAGVQKVLNVFKGRVRPTDGV
jgi:hypothetical protein